MRCLLSRTRVVSCVWLVLFYLCTLCSHFYPFPLSLSSPIPIVFIKTSTVIFRCDPGPETCLGKQVDRCTSTILVPQSIYTSHITSHIPHHTPHHTPTHHSHLTTIPTHITPYHNITHPPWQTPPPSPPLPLYQSTTTTHGSRTSLLTSALEASGGSSMCWNWMSR